MEQQAVRGWDGMLSGCPLVSTAQTVRPSLCRHRAGIVRPSCYPGIGIQDARPHGIQDRKARGYRCHHVPAAKPLHEDDQAIIIMIGIIIHRLPSPDAGMLESAWFSLLQVCRVIIRLAGVVTCKDIHLMGHAASA